MVPILILHGWGSSSKNWAQVKNFLEGQGLKVYTPDLPGFGESPPPKFAWSVDDYVEWVREFCEGKGLSQFFLLGHSFGGGIAVQFINRFPEKVQKLVLVAAKLRRQKSFRYYGGLLFSKIGKLIFSIPALSFMRPFSRKILYKLIGVRDYYKLELEKTNTMKKTFQQVVGLNLIPELGQIKAPTLVIWGTKDQMTPLSDAYLAKKEIKNSELKIIEGGRHALNLERPEKLAEIILDFLKS